MYRNKSSNSSSWARADVSPNTMLRQPVYIKENNEERIGQKRKIMAREVCQPLPKINNGWNFTTKRKRSSGARVRPAYVSQSCIRNAYMLTPATYEKDTNKTVQDATGIHDEVGMDSSTFLKQQTKLLPRTYIEKFLTGNSNPKTRKLKSTSTEEGRTNGHLSGGSSLDNGRRLFKRLLSALIDEHQDLDHLSDGKSDPPNMTEWEMDFLGSVPDENLLLKELHLAGIYPEKKLPGLVENEDETDQDDEEPHEAIYPKIASELPFKNAVHAQRSSWSKHASYAISGAASDIYVTEENKRKSRRSVPDSCTKRRRCRKGNDTSRDISQKDPTFELNYPTSTKTCRKTKSKKATQSVTKVSLQEVKPASPCRATDQLIIGNNSTEGLDTIGFPDTCKDLSFLLDLDDGLLQDVDDTFNLSSLDIPMDDLSTLDFSFIPSAF